MPPRDENKNANTAPGDQNMTPGAPAPSVGAADILGALRNASPEDLREILTKAGVVPTTMGMDTSTAHALMQSMQSLQQSSLVTAMREGMKEQAKQTRRENPLYPEQSVFHPQGVYDHEGKALALKLKFRRPTFFQGVHLGGELETEEEIELCNRFTETRTAREGTWIAEIEGQGRNERLLIKVPSQNVDDRMVLPPFPHILRELLDGAEAVNPEAMHKRIQQLEAQIAELSKAKHKAA